MENAEKSKARKSYVVDPSTGVVEVFSSSPKSYYKQLIDKIKEIREGSK